MENKSFRSENVFPSLFLIVASSLCSMNKQTYFYIIKKLLLVVLWLIVNCITMKILFDVLRSGAEECFVPEYIKSYNIYLVSAVI